MLESLRRIVQEVNAAPSLDDALSIIVARVRASMRTEVCSVYLSDEAGTYVLMATEGLQQDAIGRVRLNKGQGLVGTVAQREESLNLDQADQHPNFRYFEVTGEEQFSAFLGVPVVHQRKVLGVLVVQQKCSRKFGEDEEAFLVTLSAQLAGVIAHAEATGVLSVIRQGSQARFSGIAGAFGVAVGECVVVSPGADLASVPRQTISDIDAELRYFYECLNAAKREIASISEQFEAKISKEEQLLFDAYVGLLDDESVGAEVAAKIRHGCSAQYSWSQVILEHVSVFSHMDDTYLSERASDIRDLGSRVLAHLQKRNDRPREYPDNAVLVGEELTASILGAVPVEKLAGIVSVKGSRNSHIAILARSLGIPTVMGALDLPYAHLDGHELIVDGYRGYVYSDPGKKLRERYVAIQDEDRALVASLDSIKDLPCETLDNQRVSLCVNTGLIVDAMLSLDRGAEGVGLYRTEIPFMIRDHFPSEKVQTAIYREQLAAFAPKPVTMRTLDIGGDKALPYFPISEDNPFLGWRGIRVMLDHPEIFLRQIRAMLKASEGLDNLRIMLPMVCSVAELENAIALILRAHRELIEDGCEVVVPPIGVMIEVPAAVYQVEEFAQRVDFLSVGSNDLTQYLLAVDRNNARVANLYHSFHPAVLRALKTIARDAHRAKIPVSICGEIAGEPGAALLLVAMGFDILSMNATNLLKVKSVIRSVNSTQINELLTEVMALPDGESVDRYLEQAFEHWGLTRVMRPEDTIQ